MDSTDGGREVRRASFIRMISIHWEGDKAHDQVLNNSQDLGEIKVEAGF